MFRFSSKSLSSDRPGLLPVSVRTGLYLRSVTGAGPSAELDTRQSTGLCGPGLTLAGRGVPPPPAMIFRNCFGAVCDGELKLAMTDTPFNLDIMNLGSF